MYNTLPRYLALAVTAALLAACAQSPESGTTNFKRSSAHQDTSARTSAVRAKDNLGSGLTSSYAPAAGECGAGGRID